MDQRPIVVCFSNSEVDIQMLKTISQRWSGSICVTATWRQAIEQINACPATIFIYDYDSDPWGWTEALRASASAGHGEPAFLMISRRADERLWADLLNQGGYDLLLKPLCPAEVTRTLRLAQASIRRRQPRPLLEFMRGPDLAVQDYTAD